MFRSLRYPNYRLWFVGSLVANVGTWMQRIAQDWFVYAFLTADSPIAIGVVTALQFLPILLLSPYAGLLTDRINRRRLLLITQTAAAVLALVLGALILTGWAHLWHVYLFAFALGVVSAFDTPVRQTFVSELVPSEDLANAVGLNATSFNIARLLGPALAGMAIEAIGPGWVFVLNGVSFIAPLAALLALKQATLYPAPSLTRAKGQLREAVVYVRARPDIIVIMVIASVVAGFGMNFQLTSAAMARTEFGRDAGAFGLLASMSAIGSLAGALMAARRTTPRVRGVVIGAFAFGIFSGLLALSPSYWAFAVLSIPVGFSGLTMITSANATIQLRTAPEVRGRVMALYMMLFLGSTPVCAPIVGWIAEHWGARWALGVGAVAATGVAVLMAWWYREHWRADYQAALGRRLRGRGLQWATQRLFPGRDDSS